MQAKVWKIISIQHKLKEVKKKENLFGVYIKIVFVYVYYYLIRIYMRLHAVGKCRKTLTDKSLYVLCTKRSYF